MSIRTGGIKDVVIYLAGPGKFPVGDPKWEHPDYAAKANAVLEFDQKNCVFLTHMFAMRSKQKAKVLNSDPVGHNTNIQGGGKAAPINATIPSESFATYEPGGESPEPFGVSCAIHPWMSARMIVRDSPYFAVTKPDGIVRNRECPGRRAAGISRLAGKGQVPARREGQRQGGKVEQGPAEDDAAARRAEAA